MMYNKEKHSNNILSIQTSIIEAKTALEINQLKHIVVLNENKFLGIIFKEDIYNRNIEDNFILDDLKDLIRPVYLREDFTLFDWLKITSVYDIYSLPVVEEDSMVFLDVINFSDILDKFENTGLNVESSTVLIIKKSSKTFLYSEVFQIAEANNAKIFGSYINSSDEEETEIVLNIFHVGLNELLQSYRRYDYDVVSLHEEDLHLETLKANSEYFSKYLTV